jgi:3-dehydroquinate synthase
MRRLTLSSAHKKTRVIVQNGSTKHIGKWLFEEQPPHAVCLCSDNTVAALYADQVIEALASPETRVELHTFAAGDASKCLAELDRSYGTLGTMRLGRDGMLLALGGGVVSDLTGFAAATWMRGVRFATCPTTLESAIDASIGGKTAINHLAGKNMVGAFYHPELVAIDPQCLQTLPAREVSAGLAESVKHALIRDAALLTWHEEHVASILALDGAVMEELIDRNIRIKAAVVERDERERGERAILNFGHTIGHAIEKWMNYELRHGEAVALGMIAAARISRDLGLLPADDVTRIETLLAALRLPVRSSRPVDVEAIDQLTRSDKKVLGERRRWVLLDGIGRTVIRNDVDDALVRSAIASLSP